MPMSLYLSCSPTHSFVTTTNVTDIWQNMHTFQKSWVRTEDEQLIEDLEKFYSISIKAAAMVR